MTIYNLGSINIDHVYRLAALPRAGETISSLDHALGLGGKGANQSVAAARAGAQVRHLGAMGTGDDWVLDMLGAAGTDLKKPFAYVEKPPRPEIMLSLAQAALVRGAHAGGGGQEVAHGL